MPRVVVPASVVIILALAGCASATTPPTASAPGPTPSATSAAKPSGLPSCDAVTAAVGALVDRLAYDQATSETNTAEEAYDQRVCVYLSPDANTQLGITIASIPFQQGELDNYMTLPNAIADERLEPYGAVLQTFATGDADDGHLDSSLYLFDTGVSITIQGVSTSGSTVDSLPQLTVDAAIDAAFAVRALL